MSIESTTKAATSFGPPSFDLGASAVPYVQLEPSESDSLDRENFPVPRSEEVWDLDSILTRSHLPSTDGQHNPPGILNPVLIPKALGFWIVRPCYVFAISRRINLPVWTFLH